MKKQNIEFRSNLFHHYFIEKAEIKQIVPTIYLTFQEKWELYNQVKNFSEDGDIFLSVNDSLISNLLLKIQTAYLNDIIPDLKSQWSHTGFIYQSRDKILHSYPFGYTTKSLLNNGVQFTNLKKYLSSPSLYGFAIIKLNLSDKERKELIDIGLNYLTKGYKYGFFEILGTLLRIIQAEIFNKPEVLVETRNILNSPKGLYCSAFVLSVLWDFCQRHRTVYSRPFGNLDYELSLVDFLYYPELEVLFTPNPAYLKLIKKIVVFYKSF